MTDDFNGTDKKLRHHDKRCAELNKLREANKLCDVTLIVGGKRLRGHRVVLSSGSPYFCKMFTSSMVETNLEEISIPDINYDTMEQIIEFLYTLQVRLTTDNSQNILIAANFLEMLDLVELCGKYIVRQIDATNCFSLRDLLIATNCDEKIITRAKSYINKNVAQITENESFLQLDIDNVVVLLSSTEVCCVSEEDVVHGAIRWLNADEDRKRYAQQIFNCIRLPLLSDTFKFEHIDDNPLFNTDIIKNNISNISTPRTIKTTLVALSYSREEQSIEFYNSLTQEWAKLVDVEKKNYRFIAANNDYLVLSGWENRSGAKCFFDLYNLKTKQWTSLPSLERRDRNTNRPEALLVVGCRIYFFGKTITPGTLFERGRSTVHVAIYNMEEESWTEGLEFSSSDSSEYLAVDKYIYILEKAGYDGQIRKFDTETQTVDNGIVVKGQRWFTNNTAYKEKIYFSEDSKKGPEHPTTFKVYDPVTNETKKLAPARYIFDLFATSDGIYAKSARDGNPNKLEMEFYDVENNEWRYESAMPERLSLFCAIPTVFATSKYS